jgi:hypothetical protein
MGEWWQGYRTYKVWMGMIVLFLASFVQSCSEFKHSIWGKTAQAHIDRVEASAYEKKRDLYIAFNFTDEAGKNHFVKRTVSKYRAGPIEPGQSVEVIYFKGTPERARLVSERSFYWPAIFLGMLGFGLIWTFVTYKRMEAGKF